MLHQETHIALIFHLIRKEVIYMNGISSRKGTNSPHFFLNNYTQTEGQAKKNVDQQKYPKNVLVAASFFERK